MSNDDTMRRLREAQDIVHQELERRLGSDVADQMGPHKEWKERKRREQSSPASTTRTPPRGESSVQQRASESEIAIENKQALTILCSTLILGAVPCILLSRLNPGFAPMAMFLGAGLGFVIPWTTYRLGKRRSCTDAEKDNTVSLTVAQDAGTVAHRSGSGHDPTAHRTEAKAAPFSYMATPFSHTSDGQIVQQAVVKLYEFRTLKEAAAILRQSRDPRILTLAAESERLADMGSTLDEKSDLQLKFRKALELFLQAEGQFR